MQRQFDLTGYITYRTARSGGPGGQHVNKTNTKVELLINIHECKEFTEAEQARITAKLANRIDTEGILHVVSQNTRSQLRNKEEALKLLHKLITQALHIPKPRKKARIPRGVKEARLKKKKAHGEKKKLRGNLKRGEW